MRTAVELSLGYLRKLGYEPWVVERFNHHAPPHGVKIDLFNLGDIEAIADDHTLYVQATTVGELADHIGKALSIELPRLKADKRPPRKALEALLACPARRFAILAWEQDAKGKPWSVRGVEAIDNGEAIVWGALPPPGVRAEGRETRMDEVQTSAEAGR